MKRRKNFIFLSKKQQKQRTFDGMKEVQIFFEWTEFVFFSFQQSKCFLSVESRWIKNIFFEKRKEQFTLTCLFKWINISHLHHPHLGSTRWEILSFMCHYRRNIIVCSHYQKCVSNEGWDNQQHVMTLSLLSLIYIIRTWVPICTSFSQQHVITLLLKQRNLIFLDSFFITCWEALIFVVKNFIVITFYLLN